MVKQCLQREHIDLKTDVVGGNDKVVKLREEVCGLLAALSASYVVPYTMMISVTPALSRYRIPIMVFAILYAACFLARGSESLTELTRVRVWLPSLLLFVALGFAWSARVPEVVAALW